MKKIALKIDVDTYRGTREGVPRLVETLQRHHAQASFFFSVGPDHTGRAIRRVFRPGFLGKVSRTSVLRHYGIKTLLYGTLLPGPDIGRNCADIMRSVRDAGFETGIHGFDRIKWQDHVSVKDAAWTQREMQRAADRYIEIFGVAPRAHAAAGWQTNRYGLRHTQHLGFDYSSDTRGTRPFIPTWDAEIIACPQLPTTLPTLDELIGIGGITTENVAQHLLDITGELSETGHVYTLHAELEGQKWLPIFEQLLQGWGEQGYAIVSLQQYLEEFKVADLPRHEVKPGTVDGRSGMLSVQSLSS
jgi:peptidoglycan/xylan/chitin deacetylase (PgdA/CDA1 family)